MHEFFRMRKERAWNKEKIGKFTWNKPYDKATKIYEVSSRYHRDIDKIENTLGYEEAIDWWSKFIAVDDAEFFLDALASEYDVSIKNVRNRQDVFSAIDKFLDYIGAESLFEELYYNISDDVAKYLIKGIVKDLDESKEKEEKEKLKEKNMNYEITIEQLRNILFNIDDQTMDIKSLRRKLFEIKDQNFLLTIKTINKLNSLL